MRNWFCLIEILVIIVIIALILILLPKQITTLLSDIKVEDNSADKNTFLIEAKNIYNGAITNMKVSNEKYHIIYTNYKNISVITVNDIKDSKLEDMSC